MNANEVSVEQLQIADGLKDLLQNYGYDTIQSVTQSSEQEIAKILGIEDYIAKIILDEAKTLSSTSDKQNENPNL